MPEALRSLPAIRYATALAALAAAALFVFWTASNAILLIFAGILFAAFLDGLTRLLGKAVSWSHGIRLAIVCAILGIVLLAGIAWGSTAVATQGSELVATLREQVNQVLAWIEQRGIAMPGSAEAQTDTAGGEAEELEETTPSVGSLLPNLQGIFGPAWTAVVAILGVLSNAVIIIFLGIFFAAQPVVYRDALLLLVPPRRRAHVRMCARCSTRPARRFGTGCSGRR
jgi:predicted PurR-regulated permease PerM